jgi:hypothetical protein
MEPTRYRITVRGRLTQHLGSAFEHLALEPGFEHTVLVGEIRDQAHLYGVLDRVRNLGLELVSVEEDRTAQWRGKMTASYDLVVLGEGPARQWPMGHWAGRQTRGVVATYCRTRPSPWDGSTPALLIGGGTGSLSPSNEPIPASRRRSGRDSSPTMKLTVFSRKDPHSQCRHLVGTSPPEVLLRRHPGPDFLSGADKATRTPQRNIGPR